MVTGSGHRPGWSRGVHRLLLFQAMAVYGITLQQATELILYSQEIYCSSDTPPPVLAEAFFFN